MNKDVIYIDVEDDITAIIGKVKDSKEKIVALVPPKRVGVLQSAVNLRLLLRAADQSNKRLVLITSNSALTALAAAAKIPIARTLQSKPELAEVSALDVDDGEDIIDGSQLPVGELMKTAGPTAAAASVSDSSIDDLLNDDTSEKNMPRAVPPAPGAQPVKPKAKNGIKVPNFNSFRKKLILIIAGVVLLIGLLIWGIFFAPRATVVISARTSDSSVNAKVTLAADASTSLANSAIKATVKQVKKDTSLDFDATGSKEVGEKASGTMTITRNGVSDSASTIPAGTGFSSGTRTFVTTTSATVPASKIVGTNLEPGSVDAAVVATAVGEEYNLSARAYQSSVSGFSARGTDMSGGSKRQIKVVSENDIQKATEQLTRQNNDALKKQLQDEFDDSTVVIDQTFNVTSENIVAAPAVDQEASSGKAKLTASITYKLSGVDKIEYSKYLDAYFAKQIEGKNDQRVYENGSNKVTFTNVAATNDGFTANIVAAAKIGPKIDDTEIKNIAKGKRYGDIQSSIEAIQGVDDVDIKFWPFWVSSAPNDINKIAIEFRLNE